MIVTLLIFFYFREVKINTMISRLKHLKNPVFLFGLFICFQTLFIIFQGDKTENVIQSDGKGAYAYLPALFIYGDGDFEKSLESERKYSGQNFNPQYLYKNDQGKIYNKFFPGVAVLQLPFFSIACLFSWITESPIDGYSSVFQFCFYLGSIFYTLVGLVFFTKSLRLYFPDHVKTIQWLVPVFYITTPILFYSLEVHSFGHLYSFVLFGAFSLLIQKTEVSQEKIRFLGLGIILGLIFLVRPTNIIVVLIIPFILKENTKSLAFIRDLFKNKFANFLIGLFGFLSIIFILFLSWKWQTGDWIHWSYNGEGFNFFSPKLFENLFSYRIGLFLQSPILIMSFLGLFFLWKKKIQLGSWVLYFVINSWVISSWWCWDYESAFGNRPFTEHFFFLIFPIVYLVINYRKTAITFCLLFSLIGIIRYEQYVSGKFNVQRFTKQNYFSSLMFWKSENHDRWLFTKSCVPFGEKINEDVLLNQSSLIKLKSADIFALTATLELPKIRSNERFYVKMEMQKKIFSELKEVFLVLEATNKDGTKQSYNAIPLFNDKLEGLNKWAPLYIELQIHDYFQAYEIIRIYIWNKDGNNIHLKNIKYTLETYKAN